MVTKAVFLNLFQEATHFWKQKFGDTCNNVKKGLSRIVSLSRHFFSHIKKNAWKKIFGDTLGRSSRHPG